MMTGRPHLPTRPNKLPQEANKHTSTNTHTLTVAHHASASNMRKHQASSAYKQPRTHTREQ